MAISFAGITRGLRSIRPAHPIRSTVVTNGHAAPVAQNLPFITIATQPGAAIPGLTDRLAQALTQRSGHPWTVWDKSLIEKVAEENNLAAGMIEHVESGRFSWLDDYIGQFFDLPDALAVQRRIASVVRRLAQAGHSIFAGHGSVFITRDMPAAVRIRLVAPLPHRIDALAAELHLSRDDARHRIELHEKARHAFLHKFWPGQSLDPASFTLTLNTASAPPDALVQSILPLVPREPTP